MTDQVVARSEDLAPGVTVRKPQVQWFVDREANLVGISITGLPPCDEARFELSAISRMLHQYKRFLLSGIYGRTKKEHARLLKKTEKKALEEYRHEVQEFLQTCPPEKRKEILKALRYERTPDCKFHFRGESGISRAAKYLESCDVPKQPEVFLPQDSNFTLPMTYTVGFSTDPENGSQKITICLFNNMAFPALERKPDGSLRVLSFSESLERLVVYCKTMTYDLRAYFDEADRQAAESDTTPDYYGYSDEC